MPRIDSISVSIAPLVHELSEELGEAFLGADLDDLLPPFTEWLFSARARWVVRDGAITFDPFTELTQREVIRIANSPSLNATKRAAINALFDRTKRDEG